MTVKELLNKGAILLKTNNIESPKLQARLLLQFILNKTRQDIIIYDLEEVNKKDECKYIDGINKIASGTPLQYITNTQEFMKMNFFVNEDVLIPQPDTEILVEETIKIAKSIKKPVILDLCTGSGAIAISLAKYVKNAKVYASDISGVSLKIAKKNANKNNVQDKIEFIESDLFEKISSDLKFDIIVSNPPYIKTDVIKQLAKDVQNEPIIALDGGIDGLNFYRKIISKCYSYLKYNGYLCLEIGYDQKIDVIELIENENNFIETYSKKDLLGNDRIVITKIGD